MRFRRIDAIEHKKSERNGALRDDIKLSTIESLESILKENSHLLIKGRGIALYRDKRGKLSLIGLEGSE